MSNNEHPITPSDDLVKKWMRVGDMDIAPFHLAYSLATQAARWGYEQRGAVNEAELQQARDEELEACCDWVIKNVAHWSNGCDTEQELRAARRPKPKSLKEQALAQTNAILNDPNRVLLTEVRETLELNRRALEALPE